MATLTVAGEASGQIQAIAIDESRSLQDPENTSKTDSNSTSDPPPYSKTPPKEELTIEKSECWREGRRLFTNRLTNGKAPDKTLTAELNRFFDKTRTLQKTIDRCEEIQADAERRSDSVGTLVDVLNSFKNVGDIVFTSAPDAIGAVWFAIGFVIKIVADDAETCQIVADVYNQVAKIAIASLLYEERCSHPGSGDNGDKNLVAMEKVIVDNIAALVCEILDFFWNTQRWAVKLKSNATESERNDGPAEPKLIRAPTIREDPGVKAKTKGLGHAIGHGMRSAGKKASEAIKDTVRTGIDAVKSGRDKIIEALTGDLKAKAQNVLVLYQTLHTDGSIHFEEMVLDSMEKMGDDVRNNLKDFKEGLDSCLNSLTGSIHRIEEKQNMALEAAQELDNKALNLLDGQNELKEGIKQLQETKKSQMFESYIGCFRRSVAHENLIQTLYTKKAQDGAANDRSWFLKQDKYKDWKSCSAESSRILCLEAKRGHGKTMTLLSVTSDLEAYRTKDGDTNSDSTFVLRFFFKLGDNELQSTLRALESVLRQLLKKFSDEGDSMAQLDEKVKRICEVLERNNIEKIKMETQKEDITIKDNIAASEETKNPGLISKIISQISAELNLRLYIVLDALDECHDLKTSNLVRCLKDLAYSEGSNIWIVVSTRASSQGNVDIENEFQQNDVVLNPSTVQQNIPSADIMTLTNNENTEELQLYLELKLRDLVSRRVGKLKAVTSAAKPKTENHVNLGAAAKEVVDERQVDEKVKALAKQINKIVDGDFSYAGMLIANLQEPSKKSLEARIKELEGKGLEDMYRRNLDVLTPGKRTLILFALKWVVWSVSDVTAIEIAEHFREVYHDTEVPEETPSSPLEAPSSSTQASYDPSDDPEIREIISHLRTAGHDFFSFSSDNDPVTAHTSVREWIQNGASPPVDLRNSEARIVKSVGGRLIFEIAVLSESIPKDYNELSELMSEEESHLSIASDILRALTNKGFQARYMPWNPPKEYVEELWNEKFPQPQESEDSTEDDNRPESSQKNQDNKESKRRRYEIRHWVDHIKALEGYRHHTAEEAKNPKWDDLKALIEKFIKPENWYRWHIQRRIMGGHGERWAYSNNCYQEPIHVASLLGLQFLIDHLYASSIKEGAPKDSDVKADPDEPDAEPADEDEGGVLDRCDGVGRTPLSLSLRDPKTVEYLLKTGAKVNKRLTNSGNTPLRVALALADTEKEDRKKLLESVKLLLKYGAKDQISDALELTVPLAIDEESTKENIAEFQKAYSEITATLLEKYDKEKDPVDVNALYLSAMKAIAKHPTQALEIWNRAESLLDLGENVVGSKDEDDLTPLHVLVRAVYDHPDHAETLIPMIKQLVKKDADPLVSYTGSKSDPYYGNPVLLAVQTRNSKLFDIFYRKGKPLFQSKSLSGACAMHYFFKEKHKPMSEEDKKMFELLVELSPPPETTNESSNDPNTENTENTAKEEEGTEKVPYFINAEDNDSREPLSWAIEYGDKDGVALLLKYKADVDDVDELGQTGLYYLANEQSDPDDSIAILRDLYEAGADMRISTVNQITVFAQAVHRQPPSVLREFVRILPSVDQKSEPDNEDPVQESKKIDTDYLLQVDDEGRNFLHRAADREDRDKVDISDILDEVIQFLTEDDRQKLLSQEENDSLVTPLLKAVTELNFPLINLLLKYSSTEKEAPTEDSERKSAIKIIATKITELESKIFQVKGRKEGEDEKKSCEPSSTDNQKENESSETSDKSLNSVDYEKTMNVLLSMSDIDTEDPLFMRLREFAIQMSWCSFLQALEARGIALEASDEYGWNAFHLARHHGTNSSLFGNGREELEASPPQPSKLRTDFPESVTISEDGLEATTDRLRIIQADRPIDLSSGRYYFEVQVKDISESTSPSWSIGIIPVHMEVYSWTYQVGTSIGLGWHGDDGSVRDRIDPSVGTKPSAKLPRWGQDGSGEMDTVGLGVDRKTGNVFFTKNGGLVGIIEIQIKGRYIPALSVPNECTARINFEKETFQFKGWEDPIEDIETAARGSGHMSEWEEDESGCVLM